MNDEAVSYTKDMRVQYVVVYLILVVGLFVAGATASALENQAKNSSDRRLSKQLLALQTTPTVVAAIKAPKLTEPAWLTAQNAAEQAALSQQRSVNSRVVTYDVTTRGAVTASVSEFSALANVTLNDSRGWSRLGVTFQQVASGGMFTLVLSTAEQLPSFSPGCSAEYSCRAGRYVIINQDRWLGATPSWNNGGGSLRDYRHMVINHETGHWLGHGHSAGCVGPGQPAEVMQQQSIDLQGCTFNAWPVASEVWSSQLGLR